MPVITVRIKYYKVSITYSFPFCCGWHGSGLDVWWRLLGRVPVLLLY